MSEEQSAIAAPSPAVCMNLESVSRISQLPIVECTVETGKTIYGKVKDYNSVTNWTVTTAENTVYKAVEVGKPYAAPVVQSLEGPIKKVDSLICSGLDYVEAKVPAVKLPPGEMYSSTKSYISNSSTIQTACSVVQPAVQTAKNFVEPAMETAKNTVQGAKNMVEPAYEGAKHMVEPAMQGAMNMVEPYVQSTMDKASAIRDYGTQKVEEYLHSGAPEGDLPEADCADCQGNIEKHEDH